MSLANGYSSLKKFTSGAIAALLDSQPRQTGYITHARLESHPNYVYSRPDLLEMDEEATLASADHEIRPIMHPKRPLIMSAGYSEVINAGKTFKTNEDQSVVATFVVRVPAEYEEEFVLQKKELEVNVSYFAVFDGHAGKDISVVASRRLHEIIKEKLTEIIHMVLLSDEELKLKHLNLGLITDIDAEQVIVGAIEEAFIAMDKEIANEKLYYRLDGGCTALAVVFMMGKIFVANAGDCRAVLYKDGRVKPLSYDHTPETDRKRVQWLAYHRPDLLGEEYTRLQFQHRLRKKEIGTKQMYRDKHMDGWALKTVDKDDIKPQLVTGEGKHARMLDTIGTTRGFGDHDLRVSYCAHLRIKPFLSCEPEVQVYDLSGKSFTADDVLIMATDGLWERFTHNTLLQEILAEKFRQQSATDARRYIVAAQSLVDEARGTSSERGWRMSNGDVASYDDISVFVIPLINSVVCQTPVGNVSTDVIDEAMNSE